MFEKRSRCVPIVSNTFGFFFIEIESELAITMHDEKSYGRKSNFR